MIEQLWAQPFNGWRAADWPFNHWTSAPMDQWQAWELIMLKVLANERPKKTAPIGAEPHTSPQMDMATLWLNRPSYLNKPPQKAVSYILGLVDNFQLELGNHVWIEANQFNIFCSPAQSTRPAGRPASSGPGSGSSTGTTTTRPSPRSSPSSSPSMSPTSSDSGGLRSAFLILILDPDALWRCVGSLRWRTPSWCWVAWPGQARAPSPPP